jgi:hypothetical protein
MSDRLSSAGIYAIEQPPTPAAPTAVNVEEVFNDPSFDTAAWLRSKLDQYERRAKAALDRFAAKDLPSLTAAERRRFSRQPDFARLVQIGRKIGALREAAASAGTSGEARKLLGSAEEADRARDVLDFVHVLRQYVADEPNRNSNFEDAILLALALGSRFEMMVVAPFERFARAEIDTIKSGNSGRDKTNALKKSSDAETFAQALAQNPGRSLSEVRRLASRVRARAHP